MILKLMILSIKYPYLLMAQSDGAVKYTDCITEEG